MRYFHIVFPIAGPTINNFSPSAQQTIEIGGSGNYECSAIGVPSAKVSWIGPNGEEVSRNYHSSL